MRGRWSPLMALAVMGAMNNPSSTSRAPARFRGRPSGRMRKATQRPWNERENLRRVAQMERDK